MPFYDLKCLRCNVVFEDFFSATSPVPTLCTNPECGADGYIQRQIPDVVYGRVPLTGQDLKKQVKKDTAALRREVATNENAKANMVGEAAYEKHVVALEKRKDDHKH
jgi:hypothetical protein